MTAQRYRRFLELADDLTMLASQIREAAHCDQDGLPSTWRLDDWLTCYKTEKEGAEREK